VRLGESEWQVWVGWVGTTHSIEFVAQARGRCTATQTRQKSALVFRLVFMQTLLRVMRQASSGIGCCCNKVRDFNGLLWWVSQGSNLRPAELGSAI
jgi:hypothetical protein